MRMKVFEGKRILAIFVAIIILITPLFVCGLNSLAEGNDINNPPTAYPENCIKKLGVELDFKGDFFGGNAFSTKRTFETTNLTKYDTYEYDVFVESPNTETTVRTYFIDPTFKNSNSGRGFADTLLKTNQWQHVTIKGWNTGYAMNGDRTEACGMLVEAMVKGDTRIVITNVCVTSEGIVSPDKYPEKTISKVKGSVNLFVSITTKESDLQVGFDPIDISYGDNVELDYYVGTPTTEPAPISLVLKDENSKRAVYSFDRIANEWQHLKLTVADFVMEESFDVTKVSSYAVEGHSVGERLYFDNFCVTGIAWPLEYPQGTAIKLGEKFDVTDTTGGKATVTPYSPTETYDFSTHDFFAFDLYIESEDSSAKLYLFLYDDTYDGIATTPSTFQRLQHNYVGISTNEWVHIKTTVSDLGKNGGKGKNSAISGFFVTGLSKNNRYIIANQCVTDLQIPSENNKYTVVSAFDSYVDYRGSDVTTGKVEIQPTVDLTNGSYLEFDASVVSEIKSVDLSLVLEDENGNKATKMIAFNANDWKHHTVKLSELDGISNIGAVKAIYVEGLNSISRICIYNLFLTKIVVPEMENKFTLKENLFDDWIWAGQEDIRRYFNAEHTPIDLTQQEFLELDVLYETEVENPTFRMFFKDVNGKGGFYDFVPANGEKRPGGWYHFTVNTSDFDTGWGFNGDPTKAVWFALHKPRTDNTLFYLVNICFTYFEKPSQNNRYDMISDTGISCTWSSIYSSSCFKTASYINADKSPVDFTEASHVELDVFIDSQEDERTIKIYFIDETFHKTNSGRGFWSVKLKCGQWKHLILDLSAVETRYEMNGDLTKAVGFLFEAMADGPDIYVFHNISLTKKATVPVQNGDLPYTPDKDSRYISDCENLMNDIGVWNTHGVIAKKAYKTEGSSSVMLKIFDADDNSNTLRFLFNNVCNFTNSQSLRFDLFVDDMTLVKQNKFKVFFTSNKRFKDMAYEYRINSADLVFGWNSFDIQLSDFAAQIGADWSKIYGFAVGIEDTNLGEDDYFYLGVDNIRVYKTFDMLSDSNEESEFDTDFSYDDTDFVYIGEDFEEITDDDNSFEDAGVTVKKVIRRKRVNSNGSADIIMIVVVVIGGVLLISGLTLSILVEIKYRKIINRQNKH